MQKSARRNIGFENCDDMIHFQFVHSAILINGCYCSARWLGLYNTGSGQTSVAEQRQPGHLVLLADTTCAYYA